MRSRFGAANNRAILLYKQFLTLRQRKVTGTHL